MSAVQSSSPLPRSPPARGDAPAVAVTGGLNSITAADPPSNDAP